MGLKDCPNSLSQVEKCECELENIKNAKMYSDMVKKYKEQGCRFPSVKCQCCHWYGVGGYYEKRKWWFWGNKVTLCADTPNSNLEMTVYHELIHGLQSCNKKRGIKGECANSVCSEIGAYYNADCKSQGTPEKRRKCVLRGVLRSSMAFCNNDKAQIEKEFNNLYESCKDEAKFGLSTDDKGKTSK